MLKTINKTTLFVTMALVSGSFLRADEPVLALEAAPADKTPVVEVYEPTTVISVEDLRKARAKAFIGDLEKLADKHQLCPQDLGAVADEGAIKLLQIFATENGISKDDALATFRLFLAEWVKLGKLDTQMILSAATAESMVGQEKIAAILLGEEADALLTALKNEGKQPGSKEFALVLLKYLQGLYQNNAQLVLPMKVLLASMPELPAEVKQEVLNLLLLKQLPELKDVLKFEICKANNVDPEFVISWVSEQLNKAIYGSYEEHNQALGEIRDALVLAVNSVDSLSAEAREEIKNRFNGSIEYPIYSAWLTHRNKVIAMNKVQQDLEGSIISQAFEISPELVVDNVPTVVQVIE